MNTQLQHAVTQVTALDQLSRRLADVTVSDATRLVRVQSDNSEFLAAHTSTQQQVEAAIDEVDGGAASAALRRAVHELRMARQDFYTNVDDNRRNASRRVAEALRLVNSATIAI